MILAFANNKTLNWRFLVAIPQEAVMTNGQNMVKVLSITTLLVLLLLGFLLNFQIKRLIKPLNQLILSVSRIKEKNFQERILVDQYNSENEIGKLETTFNEMAQMIQTYSDDMEKLVLSRTNLLKLANLELKKINQGEKLILFTDGFLDARNEKNQMLGEAGFESILKENGKLSNYDFVNHVANQVKEYEKNTHQNDDQTLMSIEIL